MKRPTGTGLHVVLYIIVLCVMLWVGYIVVYGSGGVFERREARRLVSALYAEIETLEREKDIAEKKIEFLQENKRYIEGYARELGYKKRGEMIFKFIEKKEANPDGD